MILGGGVDSARIKGWSTSEFVKEGSLSLVQIHDSESK